MPTVIDTPLLDRRETRSPRLRSLLPADAQDVAHWLQRIERGQTPGLRTRLQATSMDNASNKAPPQHYRAAVITGLRDWRTS